MLSLVIGVCCNIVIVFNVSHCCVRQERARLYCDY